MSLGFLISSHWEDQKQFPLELYGRSDEGPFLLRFNNQEPLFFVSQNSPLPGGKFCKRIKDLPLKSFDGEPVRAVYFESLQQLYEGRDKLAEMGVRSYENDIRPEQRFLMERFINGPLEISGTFETRGNLKIYTNPQIRPASYKPKFTTVSLDIETGRDGTLYSIGLSASNVQGEMGEEAVFMLGEEDGRVNELLTLRRSEKELLLDLVDYFQRVDPDYVLGWHIAGFDFAFLDRKAQALGVDLALGRDGGSLQLQERGNVLYANIKGRIVLDGPPLLRANFFSFSNMKLETVAQETLGTGKDIETSGLEKVEEIERRFREDKESLAFYNIEDCRLVHQVYLKLNIYNLLYARALHSGMGLDRLGHSTGAFDHFYLPRLHRKGFVAPNVLDMNREEHSAGGLVIEPTAGLFSKVAVFDFKSLYPAIIRTFFIDPHSRLNAHVDPVKTPAGIQFSRSEHILPEFLGKLGEMRDNAKLNGHKALSQALKILMNSFYGVMGSPRSRFYHADLPTAITTTGHWVLERSIEYFDNLGLKTLYGDTDSLFVLLDDSVDERGAEELSKNLTYYLGRLINDQFGCESHLEAELEKIYEKIYFSPARGAADHAAKKRYVGWRERAMEFVGMEYVRSDWTPLAKDFQYALFQRLFEGEPMEFFIKEEIKKLESGQLDHKLVYKRRLSKKVEEYTKSQPPHVKAALQLPPEERQRLRSISYVMTMSGPRPWPVENEAFDYQHYIEKQLRPVADSVLAGQGLSFDDVYSGSQLSLF